MPEKWWGIDRFKTEIKPSLPIDRILRSKSIQETASRDSYTVKKLAYKGKKSGTWK